jgi:pyruvate dehydrogenase E2 component (dihydrolipoamide acetyltransferase)
LITYPLWKLVKESFISKKINMAVAVIPRQGQSVETCIITEWLKKKGDPVKTGDILFSYETDKASFDGEAMAEGVLLEIFAAAGDEVPVLTNIAVIGNPGEDVNTFKPGGSASPATESATPVTETVATAPVVLETPVTTESDQRIRISPRAKAMASKMGLNTALLKGTGPNGRIIVRDLENAQILTQGTAATAATVFASTPPVNTAAAFSQFQGAAPIGTFEEKKLSNVRKLIARAMYESISTSAQLTHHMSADVRKLLSLRSQVKAQLDKGGNVNITLNDMICFAVIRALELFPEVNTHFTGTSLREFKKVHLGLAVDTPRGLMVPAVQNADDLSLKGLSARLREVADQCRKGNVNPEMLASTAASFTVSNLGNYGVEMFTPIINLPQVAILGVNTIISRPADLGNGTFGFIPVIGLSLTYDHRAVDGGPATLFLKEIKNQIENFKESL